MVTHIPKPFVPRLLISMLIVSWANNRALLFLSHLPYLSLSLHTHIHAVPCLALCPRGQVSFLPTLMRGCLRSPLLLMFLLFCRRLFGSMLVSSEPHMARALCYMAIERTEGEFSRVIQSSRKGLRGFVHI